MNVAPLRTTVVGSYPVPGWLDFASRHLANFGATDLQEMLDDATRIAIMDQMDAGLDTITDGEQTRVDFNLSFYATLQGLGTETLASRRFGPPGPDQLGKYLITGKVSAPAGLGCLEEFERLLRLAPDRQPVKMSVPGPYTLSGRLQTNSTYPNRWAIAEALLPIVRNEIERLVAAGCQEITVDEPSISINAYREDSRRFVKLFNETVEPAHGKIFLSTHLCFGNYKGHASGPRRYAPMFPAFLDLHVNEIHVEMASREFSDLEIIQVITDRMRVAVGIVDVKSYYVETPWDIASRVRTCLQHAPADRLSFSPDCGLGQTARWAAKLKLTNMVEGVAIVKREI